MTWSAGFEAIFARDGRELGISIVGSDESVEHVPAGSGYYEPVVGGKAGKRAAVEAMSGKPLFDGNELPVTGPHVAVKRPVFSGTSSLGLCRNRVCFFLSGRLDASAASKREGHSHHLFFFRVEFG